MDAWARWPDESEEAFAAFALYRDQPQGQRSITKVAQECHKQRALIGRWSARHSWVQRVAEYDRHVDQAKVQGQVDAIVEMHRRHATIAQQGQRLVLQWMQQVVDRGGMVSDLIAARLFIEAPRLERLARAGLAMEDGAGLELAAAGPTLGQLFEIPVGTSQLQVARLVVERTEDPDDDGEDLDAEDEELLSELLAEEQPEPAVREVEPVHDVVDEAEPAREVEELPAVVNGDRPPEPLRYVWEDGERVARYREPPSSPIQSAHPRRPRRRRR